MAKIQQSEAVEVLTEALTRVPELIKTSSYECFDVLEQIGKFNKEEAKKAVQLSADRMCENILVELGSRWSEAK